MNNIINYLFILVLIVSSSIYAEEVEEIIIKADWREAPITDGDTSTFVLSDNEIKAQPIKHFENLSYLVPNLNFAASDSRALESLAAKFKFGTRYDKFSKCFIGCALISLSLNTKVLVSPSVIGASRQSALMIISSTSSAYMLEDTIRTRINR